MTEKYTWPAKECPCGSYQKPKCFNGRCEWELDPSLVPKHLRIPLKNKNITLDEIYAEFHRRQEEDAEDMVMDVIDFRLGVEWAERYHGLRK